MREGKYTKDGSMTPDELRAQVIAQCKVVAHLATEIAAVHSQLADAYAFTGLDEQFLNMVGRFTARRMEALGDILNGMDAVTEDDAWTDPVFERAQKMFLAESPDA